jgi:phosphoglycerate dehydrogenase-like enzyme
MLSTRSSAHSLIILDDYQHSSTRYSRFPSSLPTTVLSHTLTPHALIENLLPHSIIHVNRERTRFPRQVLVQLPHLRLIATTGMRNRGIDLDACNELGIMVMGTFAGGNTASGTVEQTWALILSLSRRIMLEDAAMRAGRWQTGVATGLEGKVLGLVGVGRLGKSVAAVGRAFGITLIGWSPNLDEARAKEAGVELAGSLEELMRISDVVSLHMILSSKTEGMIGKKELGWMKEGAFLVNTSRGPLIQEEALLEVLRSRKIGGVGLDVYDIEPLPKDHELRTMDNVVLSPHMG